jgi:hypothetical protein
LVEGRELATNLLRWRRISSVPNRVVLPFLYNKKPDPLVRANRAKVGRLIRYAPAPLS